MQPYYYRSSRVPATKADGGGKQSAPKNRHSFAKFVVLFVVGIALATGGLTYVLGSSKVDAPAAPKTTQMTQPKEASKTTPAVTTAVNNCASNTLSQLILVSISQRHLWACDGSQTMYNSLVVTGISYLAADVTPIGTYHIYGKETNQVLSGCDTTGCWKDPVSYWMPFLDNQYGAYGFHDATWRPANAFGTINPDSADASHGCVECPLATARWLYNWDQVGTAVTIES
jgi:lipoprotein-anchoring transpeptidase ErfK/SrfK